MDYTAVKEFLDSLYEHVPSFDAKPYITLTFAQSLDGKIAKRGQQLILSGKESLAMTHRLRILHDGILVGIGTALIDDPQLNARYLSPEDLALAKQPRPIILDPSLRLPCDCKLIRNYQENKGMQPWIITILKEELEHKKRKAQLEEAGAKVFTVKTDGGDHIPLPFVFSLLATLGIKRLMIEGGAKIIQSCLANRLCDQLIITIAPKFIGNDGLDAVQEELNQLSNIKYQVMGKDIVLSATLS
ncbi:hypothetical protein G6F70_001889 [Rhizopus microsporus]|uniref:2,5-diamino-6-ribosylamino-4(3H)-pyrimidinone 5'-phosphate reductase n=2 Tax=Rhizopus TaxID=4842 RepID=A0A367KDZ0_RHIAZ|nr:hypothetical protein G6F71_003472 [Rhizopus microsporus]RCI00426.1 2,5-diamino-6-(ribosylamino)-4(3H)-pyrimidinone 5'-phosphate reductase [Rhizopus azygosporus]KAG1202857.1 hypothetical protein G6F70_001889 [Rhizopus microsporus]KAG1212965.1 hypothetical protein G6F69_003227 [Rhizopus microsporus]KAG1237530.1 hypothetical protein G6F67_001138 [Rhizopus microsporus]